MELLVVKKLRIQSNSLSLRVYNFHTAMVLDSLMRKLQCAKNGRKAAFLLSNTIAAKNAHFFEFKTQAFL